MAVGKSTASSSRQRRFAQPQRNHIATARWRAATIMVMLLCAGTPLGVAAQLQQQLVGIYDSYNKAIAAGKLPDAVALRTVPAGPAAEDPVRAPHLQSSDGSQGRCG